ncbi:MAG: GHKL domain-containing protein [Lachnospiraceae bacterium]|nr:GHKL domain-containing protein [Lachnospiraceae bacterium]
MEIFTVSFYLRHCFGFFLQFGGGILLCLAPFAEEAFRISRRRAIVGCSALVMAASALFPIAMWIEKISQTSFQALIANGYMMAALVIFIVFYFWVLQVETVKKLIVLVLALFYAVTQYLLVNMGLSLHPGEEIPEIYAPLTTALFAGTTALMLPASIMLMKRAVWKYLIEMEIESIRREFYVLLVITFLYFAIMIFYASAPYDLLVKFWWCIVPPMLLSVLVLTIFYWNVFQESVRRKSESDEHKALEIQKLQYENIMREMEQTRMLRHDMRHSLNHLSELLAEGDEDSMKSYLSELSVQTSHRDTVNYCKNTTVNGLLQYYTGMAADWNIQCKVRAECGDVGISPVDLTVLLGNVMENAIHACEKIEENRWITVEIGVINGSMLIQAANPCKSVHPSGKYRLDGSFLPASAYVSDRIGGGYGLYSLERTALKYGGNATFQYDEQSKIFTTRVRLNLYPAKAV